MRYMSFGTKITDYKKRRKEYYEEEIEQKRIFTC